MTLRGRVALVTGATRGIGRAVARRLAQEGAALSLCGRNKETLQRLREELEEEEVPFYISKTDVSSVEQVKEMIEKTLDKFGKIDILINNAGITADQFLVRMQEVDWKKVLDTNLTGVFLVSRAVVRGMIKAHYGRIVNLSSIIGIMGNAGQTSYAASKAGVVGFTKSLARELAPRGITCNAVAPGFIETDMTGDLPEATQKAILSRIPLGRFGTAEEVAEVIRFLVSEEAGYITGQVIRVDGGMATF